ncbi:MAG: ADP-ribosylglycohydrolase family protein [Actinobacteria bacterium]|nr:ADP-ribosylglycohydrolase family protein [Actinomycetota bacterium]
MSGLAIGDALGRPVEGMSAQKIRENYGSVQDFLLLSPGGSDDTEYALLTASAILEYGLDITADQFADFWKEKVCTQTAAFLGAGFSEMSAIDNLRRGLAPPQSGQHTHAWSDGLAMRVAPIGIVAAGNLPLAISMTTADGSVSHSGEGIWSGLAVAAAISVAMNGGSAQESFAGALQSVPQDSWTYRALVKVQKVIAEGEGKTTPDLVDLLLHDVAVEDYYYADLAPEAVSLALAAVLYGAGDFVKTLLFAVNLGRDADTIAAMAGAVGGALVGYEAIPDSWRRAIVSVKGSCLEFAAGLNPVEVAEQLVALKESK